MASRQNKEAREVPSYGAPLDPPKPSPDREAQRKKKLETKPTAEERTRRIEEHEERGIEETAKRRRERQNRRTESPKPVPYESVRPGGGTPAEILKERGQDVETAIERAEGVELKPEPVDIPVTAAAPKPIREIKEPKRQ